MLKKLSFIKKIFTVSFALWTVAILVSTLCSYGLTRLLDGAQLLDGTLGMVVFYLCESGLIFSGVLICYWASPYRGKKITVAPTDSVKELLDNIVKGYSNGPYTVITLDYKTFPLRDAVCKRLNQELFERIYKEAAEELGGILVDFTLVDNPIDCEPGRDDGDANAGIRNIQVTPK